MVCGSGIPQGAGVQASNNNNSDLTSGGGIAQLQDMFVFSVYHLIKSHDDKDSELMWIALVSYLNLYCIWVITVVKYYTTCSSMQAMTKS